MSFQLHHLLRRTFLGVAALAAVASVSAQAQSVTKSEGGTLCNSYSDIRITPLGGISISGCSAATTTAGPAGTVSIASTGIALPWNITSDNTFTISRTGGSTGAVTVNFQRGGGCGPLPLTDSVVIPNGAASTTASIRTPNNDTTCKITLTGVTGDGTATAPPTLGAAVATVAASSTAPQPGNPGGGGGTGGGGQFNCPTIPRDANAGLPIKFGGGIDGFLGLSSGQIGYGALPLLSSSGGAAQGPSGKLAMAITTNSPTSGTVDISISHCPGVIDTNGTYAQGTTGGKCYAQFPIDQNERDIYWFEIPGRNGNAATDTLANLYAGYGISLCEAYASNGPWYVTVKYTFPDGGIHNMAFQWQFAGMDP
jgi:hypothetical protein